MQTTLEQKGWYAAARCGGIFRFQYRTIGKIVFWILAISLGSGLLSLILPLVFPSFDFAYGQGISVDVATPIFFAMICGCIITKQNARFLFRFGTPRFSVWLCGLLSLLVAMLLLLVGMLLVNIALAYAALCFDYGATRSFLPGIRGSAVVYNAEFLAGTLSRAVSSLPGQVLAVAEYVSIFYLFGCCLRRAKWWTLTVVVGIPVAFLMMMIIPAVRETIEIVADNRQSELMIAGVQWMNWLTNAVTFMQKEWPTIQLLAAIAALPLSYFCMRGTKQP